MNRTVVKNTLIIATVIIILGVVGSIALFSFRVREIVFIGERIRAEVNEKLLGGSTIFFPAGKIRDQMLREYPVFSDVSVSKKLPGTIVIEPKFREGAAVLITEKTPFLLDTMGYVIDIASSTWNGTKIMIDVPVIRLGNSVADARVKGALSFLRFTKDFFSSDTIQLSPDGTSLEAEGNGMKIYFSWDTDEELTARTLQSLILGFRIKGITPRVIDIRFSKPVYY